MRSLRPASPPTDPSDPASIAARISAWGRGGHRGPVTLEMYPTLSCNLDCAFCDTTDRHRPPVDELSTARWLTLLDEAAQLGVRRVFVLGGGEPLARRDCSVLLCRIKELGFEGILTTNATLLTADLAHQLVETGWDEVHVSLDGPTPAIHDRLRGREGAFRRAVRNTCRLGVRARAAGAPMKLAIHFVITNQNWRTLPDMVRLAESLGVTRIDFDHLIAYTDAQRALALSEEERHALREVAAEALALARSRHIATTLEPLVEAPGPQRGETIVRGTEAPGVQGAPCLKAWHYLVVQADGKSSPCCVLAGSGGSARTQPLADIWDYDPFLLSVRRGMLEKRPLSRCSECSENILRHEGEIRRALPAEVPGVGDFSRWT